MDLFNATDFTPRYACGKWDATWMAVYIGANVAIGLSYFAIPLILLGASSKKLPFKESKPFALSFAAFIFFCGTGHILDETLSFVWPAYRLFAVWHVLTAVASWLTAVTLPSILTSQVKNGGR